jgi:hypothetical protein
MESDQIELARVSLDKDGGQTQTDAPNHAFTTFLDVRNKQGKAAAKQLTYQGAV